MTGYDPTDLRGQEMEKEDAETRRRLAAETEAQDLIWLMNSRRGRRMVWRWLTQAGVFRSSFNTNALQMAFNEGYRNFGNRVLDQIHAWCAELYPVMTKENTHGNGDGNGHKSN